MNFQASSERLFTISHSMCLTRHYIIVFNRSIQQCPISFNHRIVYSTVRVKHLVLVLSLISVMVQRKRKYIKERSTFKFLLMNSSFNLSRCNNLRSNHVREIIQRSLRSRSENLKRNSTPRI